MYLVLRTEQSNRTSQPHVAETAPWWAAFRAYAHARDVASIVLLQSSVHAGINALITPDHSPNCPHKLGYVWVCLAALYALLLVATILRYVQRCVTVCVMVLEGVYNALCIPVGVLTFLYVKPRGWGGAIAVEGCDLYVNGYALLLWVQAEVLTVGCPPMSKSV